MSSSLSGATEPAVGGDFMKMKHPPPPPPPNQSWLPLWNGRRRCPEWHLQDERSWCKVKGDSETFTPLHRCHLVTLCSLEIMRVLQIRRKHILTYLQFLFLSHQTWRIKKCAHVWRAPSCTFFNQKWSPLSKDVNLPALFFPLENQGERGRKGFF